MTKKSNWIVVSLGLIAIAVLSPTLEMTNTSAADARAGMLILRATLVAMAVVAILRWYLPFLQKDVAGLTEEQTGILPHQPLEQKTKVILILVLGVAFILRLIHLNSDLWLDEVVSLALYFRLPIDQIPYSFASPNQHFFYSLLASISMAVFGESEWAVRLPAVLLGIASLWAMFDMARLVTTERQALLATVLMAFSYHHLWFSQNARGYTGMLFFGLLSTAFFIRAVTYNKPRFWVVYVIGMSLGMYTLQTSAFIGIGHFLAYFLLFGRSKLTPRVLEVGLATALLTVLLYSLAIPKMIHFWQTEERTGLGGGIQSVEDIFSVILTGLQGGAGIRNGIVLLVLLVACGVGALGFFSFWKQSRLMALIIALPPVLGFLAVIFLNYGAYPRAFLYVLPFGILTAVRGVFVLADISVPRLAWVTWSPQKLATLLLIGMISLSALTQIQNYRFPKQDYTGALAYVDEHKQGSDVVMAVGQIDVVYQELYAPHLLTPQSLADLEALEATSSGRTLWVIYSFPRDMRLRFEPIYDYLQANYELIADLPGTLGDGTLYLMKRTIP